MKLAIVWKESIYKNDFKCKCGAVLADENGKPTDNVGVNGENSDDPRLFCIKCKELVGVEKEVDTDMSGKCGHYEGQFGELENFGQIKCWAFGVGNLTMNPLFRKMQKEIIDLIKSQDGFKGLTPMYPRGTLLVFDTENNAKGARNILRSKDIKCGGVSEVYVEARYLQ